MWDPPENLPVTTLPKKNYPITHQLKIAPQLAVGTFTNIHDGNFYWMDLAQYILKLLHFFVFQNSIITFIAHYA